MKSQQAFCFHSSSTDAPTTSSKALIPLAFADAAATGHFIREEHAATLVNLRPDEAPTTIEFANGTTATSSHEGQLRGLAGLPPSATAAKVFPAGDLTSSLLSISQLCDGGCTATFTRDDVTIYDPQRRPLVSAPRDLDSDLWCFDLSRLDTKTTASHHAPPGFERAHAALRPNSEGGPTLHNLPPVALSASLHSQTMAERVRFIHRTLGAPAITTFIHAADCGFLQSIPGFSDSKVIRRNPPRAMASAQGHLDAVRQHLRSTHPSAPAISPAVSPETDCFFPSASSPPTGPTRHVTCHLVAVTGRHALDATGPIPAPLGVQYHLMMFAHDPNYLHIELTPSRQAADVRDAVVRGIEFFTARGFPPLLERLDNEISGLLAKYFQSHDIAIELVPPKSHRRNPAERAIRTWANHFEATLACADPTFPFAQSARLKDHAECTLNLLRASRLDPTTSAWAQLHGEFNYEATPLAPAGTVVAAFEHPEARATWAPHAIPGFYVGPAFNHYRCFHVWLPSSQDTRIVDTLDWFPRNVFLPGTSPHEDIAAASTDLCSALDRLAAAPITATASWGHDLLSIRKSLSRDLRILRNIFDTAPTAPPPLEPTGIDQRVPSVTSRVVAACPEWSPADTVGYVDHFSQHARPRAPRVPAPMLPAPSPPARDALIGTLGPILATPDPALALPVPLPLSPPPLPPPPPPLSPLPLSQPRMPAVSTVKPPASIPRKRNTSRRTRRPPSRYAALSAIANASGKPLKWSQARKDPSWQHALSDEWRRLIETTKTLRFAPASAKPPTQKATYINLVCTDKVKPPNTFSTKRVRATCGDGIDYPGPKSAQTASLDCVKLLLNSVISTPGARFMTLDLKDFYLHSELPRPEYAWVTMNQLPADIQADYDIASLAVNGKVLLEITKGIYGLPQAGKLAQDQLITVLAKHGFSMCPLTPCLFRHAIRDIAFCLIVDDFGVKYNTRADAQFLANILAPHYQLHIDWSGDKFLGISLGWEYEAAPPRVSLSLPGFVPKALDSFGDFTPRPRPTHSPGGYVRPTYGASTQLTTMDDSALVSEARQKRIMSKIGAMQWYTRVVDPTGKCRLSQLSAQQAHATEQTERDLEEYLHYMHSYPDARLVYFASSMQLQIESDAAYNSEPKACSRAGGVFFLGPRCDDFINAPIDEISTRIDAVVASATEAEYAALFLNARKAVSLRQTLEDLGHPQGVTPIISDNNCAVGLANDTVKHRRSKAIDMRFHWIRDRVRQGQFSVSWAPGKTNLADFFTKNHPTKHHRAMRQFFVQDLSKPAFVPIP